MGRCGSRDITTSDVDTTDGLRETAHICAVCGAAWPMACIAEDLAEQSVRGITP